MKSQKPMISRTGRKFSTIDQNEMPVSGGACLISTLCSIRSLIRSLSRTGAVVLPVLPSLRSNLTVRSSLAMSTLRMRSASTSAMNCE